MGSARRARVIAATFALTFALLGGAACQLVAGLELPVFADGPIGSAPESGVDASDNPAARVDPCAATVPPRGGSAEAADGPPQVFAMEGVDFPERGSADTTRLCELSSLNLDGFDTCSDAGSACRARAPVCDAPGGRDGQLAALLTQRVRPAFLGDANAALRAGAGGVVFEVLAWNGTDDDASIRVAIVGCVGTATEDGGPPGDAGGAPPRFEGDDTWVPDVASLNADRTLAIVTSNAYVTGGVLVARFPGPLPVQVGGPLTRLGVSEVVVSARVVRDASGAPWRLDLGRIAGRIEAAEVWKWVAGALASGSLSVCNEAPKALEFRDGVVKDVCATFDLAKTADAPCDALSFGVGFYAVRARRGVVGAERTISAAVSCPDAGWPPTCAPP